MSVSGGREADGGPRPRKRIITANRREQNRIAQQLYRQRPRDRVRNQESHRHGLPGKQRQLRSRQPREPRGTLPQTKKMMPIDAVRVATVEPQTQSDCDALFCANALQSDHFRSLNTRCITNDFVAGDGINANEMPSPSMAPTAFLGVDSGIRIDSAGYGGTLFQAAAQAGSASGPPVSNFPDSPITEQDPLSMFNSSHWPVSMNASPLVRYTPQQELLEERPVDVQLQLSNSEQNSDCYPQNYTYSILMTPGDSPDTVMDAPSSRFPAFEEVISGLSKFLYGHRIPISSRSSSTLSLPDPYLNFLQCSLTATLLAYFYTAPCIGLKLQDLWNNRSPFYRPNTTMADDPQALLAAARKPWIPMHLQPTLQQILIPHHPYLDLLPFPAFRARAITFAATAPQLFHPMELKKDVLRDGLYCYSHGDGQRIKQPWDIRSWEVAPWFLKKWRMLID
ncbi:MAG: hypothetical protein M1819_002098 [Sarea resinae]|nr:MAG: hypothetical protein M1819_002098 [Sarea resinae]